ncbi:MAG: HlyD family efflux transporter periplasmic adaptor subunit [Clostridiaceae bacterium]|nr:HlyD family efflux transporter periplasmic adaptor subunit [Clostridiaceae bacterium]
MRAKKNKISSIYIFPALFLIICLSYLIRFMFFNIETEIVKYGSLENSIKVKALIIRNESVTTLPAGVEINYSADEGDRVSLGKKVLEIVKNDQADESISLKIKQLDDRIQEIKQSDINNNFFSKDKEKIDSQINEKVADLKNIARSGDLKKLDTVKNDLSADLYKKSLIYGEGSFFGKNLEQLQKEKAVLEGIYNNSIDVIYAQTSGIVSYSLDGYEQILGTGNIKDFKLSNMKEIMNSLDSSNRDANKNTAAGIKIVDNFEWYTCSLISLEQTKDLKIGKKIRLRFTELGDSEVNGEIYEVSQPESDICMVIIKINEHVNDFYKKRIAEIDIIKDYNEGFTVPARAIVVKDNIKGLYVLKNGVVRFIPVAVMNEDRESCLVKNLESDYALEIFDEVVVTTEKVKENQVLTDKI